MAAIPRKTSSRAAAGAARGGSTAAALAAALLACSSGNGAPAPFVVAAVVALPDADPSGLASSAVVAVLDAGTGAPFADATVTVNGVALAYAPSAFEYEGVVAIAPGEAVTVRVAARGGAWTASEPALSTFPTIVAPAADAAWPVDEESVVAWTPATPAGSATLLGLVDAARPDGNLVWPADGTFVEAPGGASSYAIPANTLAGGERLLLVGTVRRIAFAGAASGSELVAGSFRSVPVTALDDTGRFWSRQPTAGIPDYASLRGIAWTGTQAVVVGDAPDLRPPPDTCVQYAIALTSPDGQAWTLRLGCGDTSTMLLSAVAAAPAGLVAVGPRIVTSPDGIAWSEPPVTAPFLAAVAWTGSGFVAVGQSGAVLTSPDGLAWTARDSGTAGDLLGVAACGGGVVAVGAPGAVLRSADGVAWTSAPSGTTSALFAVACSDARIVAVGGGGAIVTSTDGQAWTAAGPLLVPPGTTWRGIVWTGRRFLAVGSGGVVAVSPDGLGWSATGTGTAYDLYGVTWTGTRYLAVGDSATVLASPP